MEYRSNPRCNCGRCRMAGMMGPAVLVTLGGLFLLREFTTLGFQWPVLLLVIGLVMLLQHTAPMDGHHDPRVFVPPAVVTPPPATPVGNLPPEQGPTEGVRNV